MTVSGSTWAAHAQQLGAIIVVLVLIVAVLALAVVFLAREMRSGAAPELRPVPPSIARGDALIAAARGDLFVRLALRAGLALVVVTLAALLWGWASLAQARDDGRWADADPARRQWFRGLEIPERFRIDNSIPWKSCCDAGDVVPTRFRVDKATGADVWLYEAPDGTWKPVPPEIVINDKRAPDGRGYLFANDGRLVCFVPPGGDG